MKTKPMIMAHGNLILPLTVGQKARKHIVKSGGSIMETIKWENANALEIGMLMEMAEDGYVFCIEDGKIQAVEVRIFS